MTTCKDCKSWLVTACREEVTFCDNHAAMIEEHPRKIVELQTLNDYLQKKLAASQAEVERLKGIIFELEIGEDL